MKLAFITTLFFGFVLNLHHAIAGGSATMKDNSNKRQTATKIEYNDQDQIRVSTADNAYMLIHADKLYSVSTQNGKPTVMELGSAMRMVAKLIPASMQQNAFTPDAMAEYDRLENNGQSEQIAGFKGTTYTLHYVDKRGKARSKSLVLSSHPQVRELTATMAMMSNRVLRSLGQAVPKSSQDFINDLRTKGLGVLRSGDEFELQSLNGDTPDQSRFNLPAKPTQLPSLKNLFGTRE